MYYSLTSITALIVTLIVHSNLLFDRSYKPRNLKALRAVRFLIVAAVFFYITDILWGYLDQAQHRIFVEIDTSLYFVSMGVFLFAWFNFIAKYVKASKGASIFLLTISTLFLIGGITLAIINPFYPTLFSYSTDVFVGGRGRIIYLLCQVAVLFIGAIYSFFILFFRKGEKTTQYAAIGVSCILLMAFTLAQCFNPLYPFYGIGCLLLLTVIHTYVAIQEREAYRASINIGLEREKVAENQLNEIKEIAYKDPLTGVRSKHSYVEFEQEIDKKIRNKSIAEFALFLFDLNDLKVINDTYGHDVGNKFIIKSCDIIKKFVGNAPLFRYGGDEFVVYLEGDIYSKRFQILEDFNNYIEQNINTNEPIVAAGFSDFILSKDNTLSAVFTRADERMYHRKRYLKGLTAPKDNADIMPEISTDNARLSMYELFYYNTKISLIDMLNSSNADEVLEVDFNNDTFKQIYHVEGKYFTPDSLESYSALVNFAIKHVVHPDDVGSYMNLMKIDGFFERLKNARIPNFDFAHFRYKLQGGEYRYVEQCVITGKENGFEEGKFKIFLFDINNMKTRQLGLVGDDSNIISYGRDQVTNLYTGQEFFKKVKEKLKEEVNSPWCIVAIDIEHFRIFSEWFGRDRSRALLVALGEEFVAAEKEYNGVGGYFGQDDFVFLMELDEEKINGLYNRTYNVIKSFDLTGGLLPAFGVAEVEPGLEVMDVLDRATISISKAKSDIDKRISYYSIDKEYAVEQEYRILSNFANALENDEIAFYLQPQCRISTSAIVGAEALARWVKKDGTIVSPVEFVPVLEKYRFITDLDKYLWEKVCKWISERVKAKKEIVPISINVSRIDLYNLDLATYLHELCDKYQVPHKLLKVEITESAYATATEKIEQIVERLHDDGFMVMMDDFGSGYSSLNMLSTLKLDVIKLDARFLQLNDKGSDKGIHIIESVVNMAKTMALPIVVEGVETKEQTEFLAGLGCRYAQGYYFYKPIPIEKFEKIISNKAMVDHRGIIVKINEQFRIREFLDKNIYSDSMLNNIIGAVAIYSVLDTNIDIIRYNEQFYKTVDVPDFVDRLVNIEQFVPEEDRPGLYKAFEEAKENKLLGGSVNVRFYLTNGNLSFYQIRFYYLGKKEGRDQYYGSAHNVSSLLNAVEQQRLISEYSSDSIIFISKEYGKWHYEVSSHGLAKVFGLSTHELEEELNNGNFAKRITNKKELKALMQEGAKHEENKEDFVKVLPARDKDGNAINIQLSFVYVKNKTSNIIYLLHTSLV